MGKPRNSSHLVSYPYRVIILWVGPGTPIGGHHLRTSGVDPVHEVVRLYLPLVRTLREQPLCLRKVLLVVEAPRWAHELVYHLEGGRVLHLYRNRLLAQTSLFLVAV